MISDLLSVNLIKELGLDTLPAEKRQKLIDRMIDTIQSRISMRLLSMLTEDQKKELDAVLAKDGDVAAFMAGKIPNTEIIVAEIIADFKKEMLEMSSAVDNVVADHAAQT